MKTTYSLLLGLLLVVTCGFTSCATTGPQPAPSALDKRLFDITETVDHQTNIVTNTNYVTVTNIDHTVVVHTNVVFEQHDVFVTNYAYVPKATITQTVDTAGALGGPWGTAAAAAVTGALSIFAWFKNKHANTMEEVAGSASVALDTAKKVMINLPGPAAQAAAQSFNNWLASHQSDVDLAHKIAAVTDDFVDPTHNTTVAAGIIAQATQPIKPTVS